MMKTISFLVLGVVAFSEVGVAGLVSKQVPTRQDLRLTRSGSVHSSSQLEAASKGFGAPPKNSSKSKKPNKKKILKKLEKTYGGTSPQDIARGTQRRIDAALTSQPPHLQLAIQIYRGLQQWNQRLDGMTLLQQANIPVEEMNQAKRAQAELDRLMKEEGFSERDIHNVLQQATWDASADAKAARSITGEMPKDIQERVKEGCELAAAVSSDDGRVLDVGCGFGVLVPFLRKAGIEDSRIHGVDLSPEMIRNAQELYPLCRFEATDFYSYTPPSSKKDGSGDDGYDAVIFCSSLHDLPDMMSGTLSKARELLKAPMGEREGGTLIVMHPQGAGHVAKQVTSNPTLVPRGLPTVEELNTLEGFRLVREPTISGSRDASPEGYLAVLERIA